MTARYELLDFFWGYSRKLDFVRHHKGLAVDA